MRSYTYTITPKRATEMAQEIHNEIDVNGETNCEAIIDEMVEKLGEGLRAWLEENVDWTDIAYADLEAKNDYHEYIGTQLNAWATA